MWTRSPRHGAAKIQDLKTESDIVKFWIHLDYQHITSLAQRRTFSAAFTTYMMEGEGPEIE